MEENEPKKKTVQETSRAERKYGGSYGKDEEQKSWKGAYTKLRTL